MRILSYRNKRRLKTLLWVLLVALAIFLMFCVTRFIYLQRFLVYQDGNVVLDYAQDLDTMGKPEPPPWDSSTVTIITEEPTSMVTSVLERPMEQLSGYYITTEMLGNVDAVRAALEEADKPQTIMLDLKSVYGSFYYSSGVYGAVSADVDIRAIDALIEELAAREDLYLIARVASLTDNNFALDNQSCGLPLRSGALWMSGGCYWLDPMATAVQEFLVSIAQELAFMGFDEVVFDDFRIPDSENIVYKSDLTRDESAAEAARLIREMLVNDPIRVSFNTSSAAVAQSTDRVYLVTQDGAAVAGLVDGVKDMLEDLPVQIVFLTPSRDTRFDGYGLLRPLIENRAE